MKIVGRIFLPALRQSRELLAVLRQTNPIQACFQAFYEKPDPFCTRLEPVLGRFGTKVTRSGTFAPCFGTRGIPGERAGGTPQWRKGCRNAQESPGNAGEWEVNLQLSKSRIGETHGEATV